MIFISREAQRFIYKRGELVDECVRVSEMNVVEHHAPLAPTRPQAENYNGTDILCLFYS